MFAALGRVGVLLGEQRQRLQRQDRRLRRAEAAVAAALLADPLRRVLARRCRTSGRSPAASRAAPARSFRSPGRARRSAVMLVDRAGHRAVLRVLVLEAIEQRVRRLRGRRAAAACWRRAPRSTRPCRRRTLVERFGLQRRDLLRQVELLRVLRVALDQRPDDVGVGGVVRRAAEGVERRGLRLKPPLPSRRDSRYCCVRLISSGSTGCTRAMSLNWSRPYAVSASCWLVGRAEPLEALPRLAAACPGTRTTRASRSPCRAIPSPASRPRVGLVGLVHVVEDQHVRVVRGRGLLEAAVRLAQQALQTPSRGRPSTSGTLSSRTLSVPGTMSFGSFTVPLARPSPACR